MRTAPYVITMAAVLTLAACGGSQRSTNAPLAPAVQHRTLDVGGLAHSYRLFTPLSVDRRNATALVLVLGGVGNSADSMVDATGFDQEADTGHFVVAYPEGVNQTWNAGYCCLLGATTGPDDVAFLSRVIDDAESTAKIDPARASDQSAVPSTPHMKSGATPATTPVPADARPTAACRIEPQHRNSPQLKTLCLR